MHKPHEGVFQKAWEAENWGFCTQFSIKAEFKAI